VVGGVNDSADQWWAESMPPPTRMADQGHLDHIRIHTSKNPVPYQTSI
jgi:hypothetical protein